MAAQSPDPVEGLWLGTVGTERERVEVGLQFRRDAQGALKLFLTQPISNIFAAEAPGAVRREGDDVFLDEFALALTLDGDRLEGTYPGPNSTASFRRASRLPTAAPIPDAPTGPPPAWQTRLNGQVFASPAVFENRIYIGTTGGVFSAVEARDGTLAWSFAAGRPIFGTALVTADAVFFTCDNGFLFRLRRDDGAEVWRYDLGDARAPRVLGHPEVFDWDWHGPRPLLADGVIYVGAGDGGFHAVDAASGTRRWRFETGGRVRGGAALGEAGSVVFGGADHGVYALQRDTGELLWKHDTGAAIEDCPLVADGRVFVGNRGGGLFALDLATGERLWKTFFWGSWVESTPVLVDGVLYVGSSDLRRVSAIAPEDGRVLWRTDVHGWSFGTPLVVGDRLFAGAAGGAPYFLPHVASFSVLDRATGRLLRRFPLPEVPGAHQWGIAGSPALAGELVIVSTIQGGLLAFPLDDAGAARSDGAAVASGAAEAARSDEAIERRDVTLARGDVTLAASVLLPRGDGPFPGVVLVHGSGSSDRSNPWTSAYAEALVARGIAVLHPDKRGSGASGGDWHDASFEALADDALAGVEFLRALPQVDRARVGVLGFSQGGQVVAAAAARSGAVAFAVDVSGSVVPLLEQIGDELALACERAGLPPQQIEEVLAIHRLGADYALGRKGWEDYAAALEAAKSGPLGTSALIEGFPTDPDAPTWRFARAVGNFDPMASWKDVRAPVLFVYGGRDTQVRVAKSTERISSELQPLGRNVSVLLFEANGHALYRDDLLDFLAAWMRSGGAP